MSSNQIDFSYALWATEQAIAMLQQGETTYLVSYQDDEHCTLLVQEGQAAPMSSTLSLADCEDYFSERKLLRGWQSIYPVSWSTGNLENQKTGSEHEAIPLWRNTGMNQHPSTSLVPEECIAFIGTSYAHRPGQWVSTLDGTLYCVIAPSIETSRPVCRYDTPVDIRTACTEAEWQKKHGHSSGEETTGSFIDFFGLFEDSRGVAAHFKQ